MTTAAEMVQLYTDAEAKVLKGQTVKVNGRELTRANLAEIRAGRQEWEAKASAAAQKAAGVRRGRSLASFD
ncbi:primosomal replication protein PriB/PriC domain protein [Marinobacterium lutimaris]|uniref:Primosomal replication protein PriB/PriC domain protein n=1 Tax=Marinobacterium lutimaris TaxID=568106 RepID=A0A1H5XTG3_9GAMM|nr:primosomal replication protein PriB/PriC domain protein [Marinobacterium lutimaris]SEG15089.1 hypothetical protein SAMN05444390_1011500 [Marinobacterium lutimaris]